MSARRRQRRLLLCVLLAALALGGVAATPAGAVSLLPPAGQVFTGVAGGFGQDDYRAFEAQAGVAPAVWQIFLTWDQDRGQNPYDYLQARIADAVALQTRLMIHLTTARRDGSEYLSPQSLALGRGDQYLLWLNLAIAASGQPVYVRPFGEMNQADHVYETVTGRAGHSPWWFRRAFRRVVLLLRGGSTAAIDARLARNGMPPVRTSDREIPRTQIAIVWTPQVSPVPWRSYPGPGYVDWIGTDFYSGFPNWKGLSRFYREASRMRKAFVLGEFGIHESPDDGPFVARLMAWIRTHRRVKMALFYQGNEPGERYRLDRLSGARRAVRAAFLRPPFLNGPLAPASP